MAYDPVDDVTFPAKKDIFIPQHFKSLVYLNNIHLEETNTWKCYKNRTDIGRFISDILRHPVVGSLPLLILGHPGAGKSLLCNMLAARILFHEYHVIIIKLRDTIADQTIQQQINQQIERDFANDCTWNEIAGSGLKKPLLIIFDGYDELLQASGKTYSNYLQRIAEFQKEQKNIHDIFVKCIITSRITLIDKALIANNTPVIMLSDFDTAEIEKWSQIWNDTNRDYFNRHHWEPFKIENTSKVFELAKQPLLLLMLALFDSNGNALKGNRELDRTQLYNSLIREFISREKRKSETFKGKQQAKQDETVETEMKRISITALGMYNRKALYIRAAELEKDLNYLLPKRTANEESQDNELSESDKLLGSFFFIHKSDSTDIVNKERHQNSAYEFLHNTFGEFLTANYIVCEMYEVLDWILDLLQRHKEDKWNLDDQKAWLISLSYAPLFSRPVVVKMIHEWSYSFFNGKGMKEKNTDSAFDFLLNSELKRILNGETVFTLKRMLEEKENPYHQEEVLKHLATYAINLIILRTIIYRKKYLFPLDRETWNKLITLWKYAFSEDELYIYSALFKTTANADGHLMVYVGTETSQSIDQGRVMKLANISSALGDETMYSLIISLLGTHGTESMDNLLAQNHLSVKARYWWHYLLNSFALGKFQQEELLPVLSDFYEACRVEADYQSLFSFYLLLHFLLKTNIIKIGKTTNELELIQGYVVQGIDLSSYTDVLNRATFEKTIFFHIAELAIDLLDYVIPDERCLEKILISCLRRKHYERFGSEYGLFYTSTLYNQILVKIMTNQQRNNMFNVSPNIIYIDEYLKLANHTMRNKWMLSKEIIFNNLEIAHHLLLLEMYPESDMLFKACIATFEAEDFKQIPRIPIAKKILIIDYLYEMFRRGLFAPVYTGMVLEKIIRYVDIKKVFPDAPETVGHLLFLLDVQMFINLEKVNRDLLWIVENQG
ncbi:MAG: AAA family ATPase [Lachnospiraceae bacterium]|nr:AAA family ATPase [Lachnospiraceae bacterium]